MLIELSHGRFSRCLALNKFTLMTLVVVFSVAGCSTSETSVHSIQTKTGHCAIVAREFNIPSVVGSVSGTVRITTGQTITVDGTSGNGYLDGRGL